MLFHSVSFLIFFPLVTLIFFLIPRKGRALWLLLASYYFYMSWNARYALLIGLSTVATYICALVLDRTEEKRNRVTALICNLVFNLGILFFFKYFNFAAMEGARLLGMFGLSVTTPHLDMLLPVGISFYTFQALGYTIDVYRGEVPAEKSLLRYALFVSFFPQLVAGPIERSGRLLSQIDHVEEIAVWDLQRISRGLTLMIWGLFMKVVIADRIAMVANTVFERADLYGTIGLLAGATAFAIQIYCDFCAYSVIAKGAALVLGIRLSDNFRTPYFAESIPEYWNRWHISLSSWFRDYVYIPLGGNRHGNAATYRNLMVTFLLSGLWHGASLTYIAWGFCHGVMMVLQRMLQKPFTHLADALRIRRDTFSCKLGKILFTDLLVVLAFVLFRAPSLRSALFYLEKLFTRPDPWVLFDGSLYELGLDRFDANVLFVSLLALFAHDLYVYRTGKDLTAFLEAQNLWFRWLVLIALIVAVLVYGVYGIDFDSSQFIYFAF